jgi:delta-aminolevulinic acid dehydratase/porphobilinogen synthase
VILNGNKWDGGLYHAELIPEEKLLRDERTMRLVDAKHQANKPITSVQKDFDDLVVLNSTCLCEYSASAIRDCLLGRGKSTDPTIIDYIEKC